MVTIPTGVTTLSYTGATVTYDVVANGYIDIKMWGGGGGGGAKAATPWQNGGGGGMARVTGMRVVAGDVIKLQVGGGGGVPTVTTLVGGLGGWPDGGDGSGGSTSSTTTGLAGGGGSSRLWRNNVIQAVAAGGGGASGFQAGGAGGGFWGQNGGGTSAATTGALIAAGGYSSSLSGDGKSRGLQLSTETSRTGGFGFTDAQADRTVTNENGGGGGGGGYYGGGGCPTSGLRAFNSGGGGSSFIRSDLFGFLTAGSGSAPPGDANLISFRANGGTSSTYAGCTPGQGGYIYMVFTPDTSIADLPIAKTVINMAAAANRVCTYYKAQANGQITLKMWGAGGGGGTNSNIDTNGNGAGAGFVSMVVTVTTGQIIKFLPGMGGIGGIVGVGHAGGEGGFPRGGWGGTYTTASNFWTGGGGGGATRFWISETLFAVAGAGGGGRGKGNTATSVIRAGAGGGTTAGDGYGGTTAISRVSGATQASGGLNTTLASENGTLGYAGPGFTTATNAPYAVISVNSGGGGGDGYYGGGGGGNTSITNGGGGSGGSSYRKTDAAVVSSATESGNLTQGSVAPGGLTDPDRSLVTSATGNGGLASTSTAVNGATGNNGAIVFLYEISGADVEGVGDIPDITLTDMPAGAAIGNAAGTGNVGTVPLTVPTVIVASPGGFEWVDPIVVNMTAPNGIGSVPAGTVGFLATVNMTPITDFEVGSPASVSGDIGEIVMDGNIGGQGVANAIIIIPFSDYDFFPEAPEAVGGGGVTTDVTVMPSVNVTAPTPSISGSAAAPLPSALILTAPTGYAEYVVDAFGSLPTMVLSAPEATAGAEVNVIVSGADGFAKVTMVNPFGYFQDGSARPYGDFSTVTVVPFGGLVSDDDGYAFGPIGQVVPTAPDATVTDGVGHASGSPGEVVITPPASTQSAGHNLITYLDEIFMTAPTGIGFLGTDGNASGDFGNDPHLQMLLTGTVSNGFIGFASAAFDSVISATAPNGEFTYFAIGDLWDCRIVMTGMPSATATGAVNFNVVEYPGGPPFFGAWIRTVLTPPTGDGHGSVDPLVDEFEHFVNVTTPTTVTILSVNILASIIPGLIKTKVPAAFAGPADPAIIDIDFSQMQINMDPTQGYVFVDSYGWAPLRMRRTTAPGFVPELIANEIVLDEYSGAIYYRAPDGRVKFAPLSGINSGAELPILSDEGAFLLGDGTWGDPTVDYSDHTKLPLPEERIALSDNVYEPSNLIAPVNTLFYRPFFVPKTVELSSIGAEVAVGAVGTVNIGICTWTPPQTPGVTLIDGAAATNVPGLKTIPSTITLLPGWYAAIFYVAGAGTAEFVGYPTPTKLAVDFSATGDPTAPSLDFDALPTPTDRALHSTAFITAVSRNVYTD